MRHDLARLRLGLWRGEVVFFFWLTLVVVGVLPTALAVEPTASPGAPPTQRRLWPAPYIQPFSLGPPERAARVGQPGPSSQPAGRGGVRPTSGLLELAPPAPVPSSVGRPATAGSRPPWVGVTGQGGPRGMGLTRLADAWTPSHHRDWIDEQRLLPYAEFHGGSVTIHNVRNARFYSYRDCLVEYEDRTYALQKLETVDFLMVPFADNRAIAHTMLSFGFEDGQYLGVSVEVRLEKGEAYNAAIGLMGQFELMYVLADERDLLPVRPKYRGVDVYLYRTTATPPQARALFVDILKRVNEIYHTPEFYDTLRNNCTTNIVRHINALAPGKVPYDYRVLLPGFADSLAYELGLIDRSVPLEELRRKARITDLILAYEDDPHFSQRIRGLPVPAGQRP